MRTRPYVTSAALVLCCGLAAGCGTATPAAVSPSFEAVSSTGAAVSSTTAPTPAPAPVDPCAALVGTLSERQRLAQLLTVGVTGTEDAIDIMKSEQVGGIFIGSWTDQSMLTNHEVPQIAAASAIAPMVTIDEEGGRVSRLADLITTDPSARETTVTKSAAETHQMAFERGKQLADFGITVDFAPDVDVSSQPADSVIGDRSFSADPAKVVEYAGAFAQGLRDAGILPVIKHFPGHGSASGDSHKGEVTTPPLDALQTVDLVPFRELANSGVGVMVGHLDVPGLTAEGEPASISPAAMNLLRNGTGYGAVPFTGPIFTDDLSGMQAITDRFTISQAVEAALTAGADVALWLSTPDVPKVLDNLEDAVKTNRLPASQVDIAAATVLRAKKKC